MSKEVAKDDDEKSPKVSKEVAKVYIVACEKFLAQVVREWEKDIQSWVNDSTRAGRPPSSVLPRHLRYAFATLLGDGGCANAELQRGQCIEEKELNKYFSKRATKRNMIRALSLSPDRVYKISTEAVRLMRQALWGRTLALARHLLTVCPTNTKFISEKIFLDALKRPCPVSWGLTLMMERSR